MVQLLYQLLSAQWWDMTYLMNTIMEAANQTTPTQVIKHKKWEEFQKNMATLHIQHHPNDISYWNIRSIFDKHCKSFEKLTEKLGETLHVDNFIFIMTFFSCANNPKDKQNSSKLHEAHWKKLYLFFGESEELVWTQTLISLLFYRDEYWRQNLGLSWCPTGDLTKIPPPKQIYSIVFHYLKIKWWVFFLSGHISTSNIQKLLSVILTS